MASRTWEHLTQTHDDYDPDLWRLLECLYEGGFDISEDIKRQILRQHPNESDTLYVERLHNAAYINYFGQVVDFFAAKLFTRQMSVIPSEQGDGGDGGAGDEGHKVNTERYEEYFEDADGEGNDFQQLMARAFITAATMRKAIVACDFPADPGVEVTDRAREEALGLDRPRSFWVHPATLIDWATREDGTFGFAVLHTRERNRDSFDGKRNVVVDRFKVWEMRGQGDQARAFFRVFQLERKDAEAKTEPQANKEVPEIVAPTPTSFRRIPLIVFELPRGLWVGNKVGPMVCEHFDRRTKLVSAQNKSLMAIPYAKLGPEMGAPRRPVPSEVQQDPHRGTDPVGQFKKRGWMRIGQQDELGFAEPSGTAYEITSTQLKELVDEIFRVSHQMAQSISATSQALARSGFSKAEDRNVAETVLEAFGEKVSQFAVRIYDTIAEALGDDVYWTVHGLSEFRVSGERTQTVEEAGSDLDKKIPSKLYRKRYLTKLAFRILGDDISPEDEQQIREEIEEAVDAQPDPVEEAAQPPPPPVVPGQPPPPEPGANGQTGPQRGPPPPPRGA